jgi:hypothetical protein
MSRTPEREPIAAALVHGRRAGIRRRIAERSQLILVKKAG